MMLMCFCFISFPDSSQNEKNRNRVEQKQNGWLEEQKS